MGKEWLTINEFIERNRGRIAKNFLYEMVQVGAIPNIRVGRKILVPSDGLDHIYEYQKSQGLETMGGELPHGVRRGK